MKFKRHLMSAAIACVWAATSLSASAVTLRVANQGDALAMDPHSLNESLQLTVPGQRLRAPGTRGQRLQADTGAGHRLEADRAHGVALQPAQGRGVS